MISFKCILKGFKGCRGRLSPIMPGWFRFSSKTVVRHILRWVTLSEWIKSIGDVLKRGIRRLKHSVITRHESIFSDPDDVTELSCLVRCFVIVPADKASSIYTFVCKRYNDDILMEEHLLPGNPIYNLTDFSASEVLDNHKSVLTSFGIQTTDEELDLTWPWFCHRAFPSPWELCHSSWRQSF